MPFVHHASPIGRIEIRADCDAIQRVDIERAGLLPGDIVLPGDTAPPAAVPSGALDLLDEARRQLDLYFAGRRTPFDLPLARLGTEFQQQIWHALAEVPFGSATSYGELAERAGRPTGARAVGGAVGSNPIALFVPCHRVLGSGRRVTGYSPGNGVPTKLWLLRHEGIDVVA